MKFETSPSTTTSLNCRETASRIRDVSCETVKMRMGHSDGYSIYFLKYSVTIFMAQYSPHMLHTSS